MPTVSTQPAPSDHCLPMEADPSGFTELAPALVSLLPDEALSQALALGEAFAVHASLAARLAREPTGPVRDTLRELLGNRALFVVAERPPKLRAFLGTGVGAGLVLGPFFDREVQLVNGLSRPVEVRLDDRLITLKPGRAAASTG